MFAIDPILLIFIIFAIFRVISSIGGKKSSQQKKTDEPLHHAQKQARRRQETESSAPAEKPYTDLVRRLQAELEQEEQRQRKSKAKQNQKTKARRRVEGQLTMDNGQPYQQVEGECFDIRHTHQPDIQRPPRPNQQSGGDKRKPAQPSIAAPIPGSSAPQRPVFPRETLVQGIIMAEILGPPLAKRKRR